MVPTGPLHPELLAAGLAVGLVAGGLAGAAARRAPARRPEGPLAGALLLAVAGAGLVLWAHHLVPTGIAGALVLASARGWKGPGRPGPAALADVATWALVALEVAPRPLGPVAVVGLAALLVAGRTSPTPLAVLAPVALAATVGLWAGAPDTEVAVVAGAAVAAALVAPAALALAARGRRPGHLPGPVPAPLPGLWVLLVWAAVDGYRGRPAGGWGAAVGLASAVAWLLAGRLGVARRPRPPVLGAALACGAALVVVAARTVGLDRPGGTRPALGVALLVAVAAVAAVGARWGLSRPAGAGRRPG